MEISHDIDTYITAIGGLFVAVLGWALNRLADGVKDDLKSIKEDLRGFTTELHDALTEIARLDERGDERYQNQRTRLHDLANQVQRIMVRLKTIEIAVRGRHSEEE